VNTPRDPCPALDPAALEAAVRRPVRAPVVALDGETPRRSFDHPHDRAAAAAHVFGAFAADAAPVPAHHEGPAAPDEIPAAPAPIEELGVEGVLVTADALHRRKNPPPGGRRHRRRPARAGEGQPAPRPV
jgi:hypothetical protein